MSAKNLLDYQKIDLNIYKIEKAYQQSDEMKRLVVCRDEIKNKRDALTGFAPELEKCYAALNTLEKKLQEAEDDSAKLDTNFADYSDIKDFDKYEKDLSKIEENVANLNKEIIKTVRKIAEINDMYSKTYDLLTKLIAQYDVIKQDAERKRQESLRGAIPFAKQLRDLEPTIDPNLLAKYKEIRKKKMPVLVPYSAESCLGCGINIRLEVEHNLQNQFDVTECPHCGRLVYKMN